MHTKQLLAGLGFAFAAVTAHAQNNTFYGKVEGGYGWTQNAKMHDKLFNPAAGGAAICGDPACTVPGQLNDIGNAWLVGAGVGWRYNQQLRTDFTITYRGGMQLTGADGIPNSFSADINSWAGLVNGYVDLPWAAGGVRPFLGGGIGYARNHIGTTSLTPTFAPGSVVGYVSSGSSNNFAWALTAGFGWEVSRALTVDVAYRYTDLGKINSGTVASVPAFGLAASFSGISGDLRLNEVTVGVRF
jgi:opacity protein-like surface antigen